MDLVNRTASASTVDASFDTLARTFGQPLPRRRALRLLAATLATGALGTAALTDAAAKGKSQSQSRGGRITAERRKGGGKGRGGGRGTTVPPVIVPPVQQPPVQQPPVQQPPVQLPDASQNCRAAGNQCGTNAGQQGACRVAVAPDNQAGFICTSNQAGNACGASTQCGANTRCVVQGAAQNCRVVIP